MKDILNLKATMMNKEKEQIMRKGTEIQPFS